jgi:hypothetical protein
MIAHTRLPAVHRLGSGQLMPVDAGQGSAAGAWGNTNDIVPRRARPPS